MPDAYASPGVWPRKRALMLRYLWCMLRQIMTLDSGTVSELVDICPFPNCPKPTAERICSAVGTGQACHQSDPCLVSVEAIAANGSEIVQGAVTLRSLLESTRCTSSRCDHDGDPVVDGVLHDWRQVRCEVHHPEPLEHYTCLSLDEPLERS